jgi:N-methylhydantoinase A
VVRVGIDTGGTFTDVVAVDAGGAVRVAKLPSTPRAPAEAVLEGVRQFAAGDIQLAHSTTVATNALLERSGGPTALVITAGFEDVLEIGRQARPALYALHPIKPRPLVKLRLGVDERMDASGKVLRAPSNLEALRHALEGWVQEHGVRSVAICLLHSYANPAHERLVAEALAPLGLPMSLSSEVLPMMREFERASTTCIDAYLRPVVAPYLRQIAADNVRILQSSGGVLSAADAAERPVCTVLSGPAAGVVGALAAARAAGVEDLVTLDMGGTSTDVALVIGGACATTDEAEVAGLALQLPMLAVHTVGAGGGSIARLDEGGALKVGPQSAGAEPGPACYGKGGALPTVTDADLILGRLSAEHFLGGAAKLHADAARAALATLGGDAVVAAAGVAAVADVVMARAIKAVSVERGVDPTGLVLVPFGGAGGMHACAVARELGMRRILVPPSPGLLCAYGALVADVLHERVATLMWTLPVTEAALDGKCGELSQAVEAALGADGVPAEARRIHCTAHLRYRGQSFDLAVEASGDLAEKFHAAHQARYGFALRDRAVELVTLRVTGRGLTPPLDPPRPAAEEGAPEIGRLTARWEGRDWDTPILSRARLRDPTDGPALIVEYSATTWLPPGARASVEDGALAIEL